MNSFLGCVRVLCRARRKQVGIMDMELLCKESEVESAKPTTVLEGRENLGNEMATSVLFPGCPRFSILLQGLKKKKKKDKGGSNKTPGQMARL